MLSRPLHSCQPSLAPGEPVGAVGPDHTLLQRQIEATDAQIGRLVYDLYDLTPAEALAQVEIAKSAWLEAARAEGKPIPVPRYRPVIYQAAS